MASTLFKTCDKRLRYTETDDKRLDALLKTNKVARYKTEVMHDAMRIGISVLEERYLKNHETEGHEECLRNA